MKTLIEATETAPSGAAGDQPKAATKRAGCAQEGEGGEEGTPAKKVHTDAKKGKGAKQTKSAREGSKTAKVLELLKRLGGVSSKDLMKATNWQPHSVRGFLSGTVGKKMGLTVVSEKAEDGARVYSIEA